MNSRNNLLLYGSGGHAKVAIHAARSQKTDVKIDLFDDDPENLYKVILGCQVVGTYNECVNILSRTQSALVVVIGCNQSRKKIYDKFCGFIFERIIHSSAVINNLVYIGKGSVVFANAVIHPDAVIGENVIINTGSIIEHDCSIGDHAHVAPGATLSGNVSVGESSMICAGATIIPGVKIGKNSVVAAGSVVTKDVPDNVMVAGNPTQIKKELVYVQ